ISLVEGDFFAGLRDGDGAIDFDLGVRLAAQAAQYRHSLSVKRFLAVAVVASTHWAIHVVRVELAAARQVVRWCAEGRARCRVTPDVLAALGLLRSLPLQQPLGPCNR